MQSQGKKEQNRHQNIERFAQTLGEVGSILYWGRVKRNLSLNEVADRLRIMPFYISALEDGDLETLPAYAYILGYVRSYARLLELDADDLNDRLKASLADDIAQNEATIPIKDDTLIRRYFSRRGAGGYSGRIAFIAVTFSFLAYGAWHSSGFVLFTHPSDPGNKVIVASPEIEVAPDFAEEGLTTNVLIDAQPQDVEVGADAGTIPVDEQTSALQAVANNRIPAEEIMLEVKETSWVSLSRADGSVVMARLMRAGDTYLVPTDGSLFISVGNAGGVSLRLGDESPIVLGKQGDLIHELPLDSTFLKERY